MIAKNDQYVLMEYDGKPTSKDGIAIPLSHREDDWNFIVAGFGLNNRNSNYVSEGDIVACDRSIDVTDVFAGVDNIEFYLKNESKMVAVIGNIGKQFPDEFHEPDISEIPEQYKSVSAAGQKVLVLRDKLPEVRKHGSILIPFSHREVGRAHTGTVIGIGSEASKKTGISIGMRVIYDYGASFGHHHDFDIVDHLNVIAVLSKYDQKCMGILL